MLKTTESPNLLGLEVKNGKREFVGFSIGGGSIKLTKILRKSKSQKLFKS